VTKAKTTAKPKKSPPDLVKAMNSTALFQPWFDGESWNGWKAVLRAMDALPMTDDEVAFFKGVAGGRNPPTRPVREFWAACARRTGKDSATSVVAAHSGAFFSQQSRLRRGERASILCLACDQSQASIILGYIKSYFTEIPMLASMVVRETKTGVELANNVDITVATNDFRSIRGRAILLAILDECAFYRSENSASPDTEVYNAIRPALASIPGSRIIGISSPYRKSGLLWDKYKKHFGQDDDDVLVIQSAVRTLNPTISEEYVAKSLEEDPASARSEVCGEFRDDIGGWLDVATIEASVDAGVTARPPQLGRSDIRYVAGCDPAGGTGSDSFTAAVAHKEPDGQIYLDALLEIRPKYSPAEAVERVAGLLKSYGLSRVVGDRYSAGWVIESFAKHGIKYLHSDRDRSAVYSDTLPIFTSGRAHILDDKRLISQFAGLERRTMPGGRDRIDHGTRGGHDDCANSAAIAMTLAAAEKPAMTFFAPPDLQYGGGFGAYARAFDRGNYIPSGSYDLGGPMMSPPGGWPRDSQT
jgi:hypothetical protein